MRTEDVARNWIIQVEKNIRRSQVAWDEIIRYLILSLLIGNQTPSMVKENSYKYKLKLKKMLHGIIPLFLDNGEGCKNSIVVEG